jgi:hypothetical protein
MLTADGNITNDATRASLVSTAKQLTPGSLIGRREGRQCIVIVWK